MKGLIKENVDGLVVEYFDNNTEQVKSLPIYNGDFSITNNFDSKIPDAGVEVDFEIVDEFTHPWLFDNVSWGDGIKCAKIKL